MFPSSEKSHLFHVTPLAPDAMTDERMLVLRCGNWTSSVAGLSPHEAAVVLNKDVVLCVTATARRFGVRAGQSFGEARRRCKSLRSVEHSAQRDQDAFATIVEALHVMSPLVEVLRPGVCTFPVRAAACSFASESVMAQHVHLLVAEALRSLQLRPVHSIGIADGLYAAESAARKAVVVPPGQTTTFLLRQASPVFRYFKELTSVPHALERVLAA